MQRAYDNIIHDFALQSLSGIFCMDRAGIVGNDGPTHHGVFDIIFMKSIPNMIVSAPKDGNEMYDLLFTALSQKLLISIRYPKANTKLNINRTAQIIKVGSWETLNYGNDICILSVGSMVDICKDVVKIIDKSYNVKITLINCRFIKPLDKKTIDSLVLNHKFFL